MYSNKRNVQILVSLLKEHGVKHAVISPGSRNMALVVSLEGDPDIACYSVVDERSAAYFAIGVSLAHGGEPVVISSTSGQATRNYMPAMTEAYYRGIPLVVITADYTSSSIGQGIMQTVDQMSIPVDSAKRSVSLPIVNSVEDEAHCIRIVNESLLELSHHGSGPVHINIAVEEHWDGGVEVLPPARVIERYTRREELPPLLARRILVVVGQHMPFTDQQRSALDEFCVRYGAVAFTHHLSNYHGPTAVHASLLIENLDNRRFAEYEPELLITIGGQIGDYAIDAFARRGRHEHWRVSPDGAVQDTFGKLTKVFEMSEEEFFGGYTERARESLDELYLDVWAKANVRRAIPAGLPLSHALVAAEMAPRIPAGTVMHFAILSSLRNWNFFELDATVTGYSNVAAFGIDGCMSTFLGHAAATEELCVLVIGDLSFFYDMNSLGIRGLPSNARVILVNNGGGGEFRLYSHAADQFGDRADEHIAAAGHFGKARGWVESVGWKYDCVSSEADLKSVGADFFEPSDRPRLMEVLTTMRDDSEGVRMVREANSIPSLESRIVKMLSPEVKLLAKKLLRR